MRNSSRFAFRKACFTLSVAATSLLGASSASAQDDTHELAKKLSNPIASLVSVPFQFNYDGGHGPDDGDRVYVHVQPVVPIKLDDDWNMISRTILPVIWQNDISGPSGEQFRLGDVTQSLFFSPATPGPSGIIWAWAMLR